MIGVSELMQIVESGASASGVVTNIEVETESGHKLGDYVAYRGVKCNGWIYFKRVLSVDMNQYTFFKPDPSHPFRHTKFHITLPEEDKCNPESEFAKGLMLVSGVLLRRGIRSFKVFLPTMRFEDYAAEQAGKVITIFASCNPSYTTQDWLAVLAEIHISLANAGVQPGPRPVTDLSYERAETGILSPYISYRVTQGEDPMRQGVVELLQPTL